MKNKILFALLLGAINCSAQTPLVVKDAFAKLFPNTTVKKWDKEDSNYEANFSKDGKVMSATFDGKGNWLETEADIKISELPASVTNYIKTKYSGSAIKEAAIITNLESKKIMKQK